MAARQALVRLSRKGPRGDWEEPGGRCPTALLCPAQQGQRMDLVLPPLRGDSLCSPTLRRAWSLPADHGLGWTPASASASASPRLQRYKRWDRRSPAAPGHSQQPAPQQDGVPEPGLLHSCCVVVGCTGEARTGNSGSVCHPRPREQNRDPSPGLGSRDGLSPARPPQPFCQESHRTLGAAGPPLHHRGRPAGNLSSPGRSWPPSSWRSRGSSHRAQPSLRLRVTRAGGRPGPHRPSCPVLPLAISSLS